MNRRLAVVGTAAVALAAFLLWAFAIDRNPADLAPRVTENSPLVRPHAVVIGPAQAPVTIVEFFDPACEACRAFYPIVKDIMASFPAEVRLVLRYAPLHQGSDEAVRILEAARAQDRFVPVLEALLQNQPRWAAHGAPTLEAAWAAAGAAGLDLARARGDAQAAAVTAVLEQDKADLKAVGVRATPTFIVNGEPLKVFGAMELFNLVRAKVTEQRSLRPAS